MIKKIHQKMPPGIRKSYAFIIAIFRSLGQYYKPINHCVCKDKESGRTLSIVHFGWDKRLLYYWTNRFSDNFEIKSQRKLLTKRIPAYLNKYGSTFDLALIETNKKAENQLYPNGFLLPRWMEMELNIKISLTKSRVKNIIRNIKKHSLEYEVKQGNEGLEGFELFYYQMYLPFLIKRHGKSAEISDYKHFLHKYKNEKCQLFFIVKDQEPIAAAFIESKNNTYRVSAFGVKDASNAIFKMGVIGALYYFVMVHFYERGIKSIQIGKSMPIIFDGVTEFKMQIGATPFGKDLMGVDKFFLCPLRTTESVFSFLKLNPLYYLSQGHLQIALFADDEDFNDKSEFLKFFKRLKTENVRNVKAFYFNYPKNIIQWLLEEEISNIQYVKMNKV